jgi:lambda repressor-like predicted transcriptional regulator
MGRSFTRSANLRGLLSKAGCPQALKNCQPIFRKLIDPQLRNTLITDIASFSGHADDESDIPERQTKPIPPIIYNALRTSLDFLPPHHAEVFTHLTRKGITYAVASRHLGNSCILVLKSQMDRPYPAQIKHILGLQTTDAVETFVVVQRYKPMTVASDPYIRYPALQAKLWSQELINELEIITPDDIHSHFAACDMVWEGSPVTAVISLFRVSTRICPR